jgi:CBS domain-containing protein
MDFHTEIYASSRRHRAVISPYGSLEIADVLSAAGVRRYALGRVLLERTEEGVMNVGKLCKRNVVTMREFDELVEAPALMRDNHIGYVVVVEPNVADDSVRPVGVLTDRDIVVSVLAKDANPRSLRVGDIMTRQPVVIGEGKPLESALQEMRRIGVRRLPVVGGRGELVGVLSLDDVLDELAGELLDVAGSVRNELLTENSLRQ